MKRLAVLLVLTMAVLSGACSENEADDTGVATLNDDAKKTGDADVPEKDKKKAAEEAMLKFTQCMRENGVDLPDPTNDGGNVRIEPGMMSPEQMQKAQAACKEEREALQGIVGPMQGPGGEDKEGLAFSRCMRAKGFDVPDPTTGEDGGSFSRMPESIDVTDPKFKAAEEACFKESEKAREGSGK